VYVVVLQCYVGLVWRAGAAARMPAHKQQQQCTGVSDGKAIGGRPALSFGWICQLAVLESVAMLWPSLVCLLVNMVPWHQSHSGVCCSLSAAEPYEVYVV
jgi:hypothetical protein